MSTDQAKQCDQVMVSDTQRLVLRSGLVVASIAMLSAGMYKGIWFLLGMSVSGVGPLSAFHLAGLIQAPAYLASAATVWRWPWVAETVAALTLVVIFARFHPWIISPFQRGLSVDYVFLIAANVAFFARMSLRRTEMRSA
jgi:hypothetical protein